MLFIKPLLNREIQREFKISDFDDWKINQEFNEHSGGDVHQVTYCVMTEQLNLNDTDALS